MYVAPQVSAKGWYKLHSNFFSFSGVLDACNYLFTNFRHFPFSFSNRQLQAVGVLARAAAFFFSNTFFFKGPLSIFFFLLVTVTMTIIIIIIVVAWPLFCLF